VICTFKCTNNWFILSFSKKNNKLIELESKQNFIYASPQNALSSTKNFNESHNNHKNKNHIY